MNKAHAQQIDPAVEEVLASIRQIMAIDLNEDEENKRPELISFPVVKKTTSRKRSEDNSDILTLTEMINTDGSVVSLSNKEAEMAAKTEAEQANTAKEEMKEEAPKETSSGSDKASSANDASAPLDLKNAQAEDGFIQAENLEAKVVTAEDIESLMSPEAVAQSAEAFNDLNKLTSNMQQKIQGGTFGAQTLDQLMREMLKPLLKDWLDSHLPSLVKWLVAEKIEQMIREKQDKSGKS